MVRVFRWGVLELRCGLPIRINHGEFEFEFDPVRGLSNSSPAGAHSGQRLTSRIPNPDKKKRTMDRRPDGKSKKRKTRGEGFVWDGEDGINEGC